MKKLSILFCFLLLSCAFAATETLVDYSTYPGRLYRIDTTPKGDKTNFYLTGYTITSAQTQYHGGLAPMWMVVGSLNISTGGGPSTVFLSNNSSNAGVVSGSGDTWAIGTTQTASASSGLIITNTGAEAGLVNGGSLTGYGIGTNQTASSATNVNLSNYAPIASLGSAAYSNGTTAFASHNVTNVNLTPYVPSASLGSAAYSNGTTAFAPQSVTNVNLAPYVPSASLGSAAYSNGSTAFASSSVTNTTDTITSVIGSGTTGSTGSVAQVGNVATIIFPAPSGGGVNTNAPFSNMVLVDTVGGNDTTGRRGGAPFLTLSNAVAAGKPYDLILLSPGTQILNEAGIVLSNGMAIVGSGRGSTVIRQSLGSSVFILKLGTNNLVKDLTLDGRAVAFYQFPIFCGRDYTLQDIDIFGTSDGIYTPLGGTNTLINVRISTHWDGFYVWDPETNTEFRLYNVDVGISDPPNQNTFIYHAIYYQGGFSPATFKMFGGSISAISSSQTVGTVDGFVPNGYSTNELYNVRIYTAAAAGMTNYDLDAGKYVIMGNCVYSPTNVNGTPIKDVSYGLASVPTISNGLPVGGIYSSNGVLRVR